MIQKRVGFLLLMCLGVLLVGCTCLKRSADNSAAPKMDDTPRRLTPKEEAMQQLGLKAGEKLYATFVTNMGNLVAELYWEKAPRTVSNFVGLAEGSKEWTNSKTGEKSQKPLYSGTIFHRVIPEFMIQGGDPQGSGMGGPGYQFQDEFNIELRHNAPGILSMANAGPNTNGSQFFITEIPTPFLDDRHAVFGKVIENVALVSKIARVDRDFRDKPKKDVVLEKIVIGRGAPAKVQ